MAEKINFKEQILKLLHKIYREDEYTNALLNPIENKFNDVLQAIEEAKNTLFFNSLNEEGCKWYEALLDLIPTEKQTLEDRQAQIQAKWQSNLHSDIYLIQQVCDAWKNGEVEADFINGKLQITFVGSYGVPEDLDGLIEAVKNVKPAHLAYYIIFKYLLIRDIHEVKTIEEMEKLGYIRRKVTMKTGETKDFLSDLLPVISMGVQSGQAVTIIAYKEPDFTQEITDWETLQEKVIVNATFIQECFNRLSVDFTG